MAGDVRLTCTMCRPKQIEDVIVKVMAIRERAISFAWEPWPQTAQLCPRCRTLRPVAGKLSWKVEE